MIHKTRTNGASPQPDETGTPAAIGVVPITYVRS